MSFRGAIAALFEHEAPQTLGLKNLSFGLIENPGWYERHGFRQIASALGWGNQSWSGENVNIHTALNHSVVWACNRIISETAGFLPCVMMQRSGDKTGTQAERRQADGHPMYDALKNAPNTDMTAMGFKETLTSHAVLRGNSYAQIARRSGTGVAMEMYPIHPERVTPARNAAGQLVYVVKDGNAAEKSFTVQRGKPHDIFHMRGIGDDGIVGYSVLHMARQSIGTALAAEKNVGNFYARGGRLPYNLKLVGQDFRTDEDFEKFRTDWERIYGQPHKAPIIPTNIEYQTTGLSLKDQQLLESRLFGIHEICRWFLVSPHLVGDLSRATFSNIEQLALEFVKLTMATWLTRWEQELWRCVLTPEEKTQGYFWRFNLNALLRGDFATRMAGYATALNNSWINPDEVRDLEDMNPIPNGAGQAYHIQGAQATLPGTGEPVGLPLAKPASQPQQDLIVDS